MARFSDLVDQVMGPLLKRLGAVSEVRSSMSAPTEGAGHPQPEAQVAAEAGEARSGGRVGQIAGELGTQAVGTAAYSTVAGIVSRLPVVGAVLGPLAGIAAQQVATNAVGHVGDSVSRTADRVRTEGAGTVLAGVRTTTETAARNAKTLLTAAATGNAPRGRGGSDSPHK